MEIDTVIALVAVMAVLNLPFYYMSLSTWKTVVRIKAQCPHCTAIQNEGGETE